MYILFTLICLRTVLEPGQLSIDAWYVIHMHIFLVIPRPWEQMIENDSWQWVVNFDGKQEGTMMSKLGWCNIVRMYYVQIFLLNGYYMNFWMERV